jgi:hypothetical protein
LGWIHTNSTYWVVPFLFRIDGLFVMEREVIGKYESVEWKERRRMNSRQEGALILVYIDVGWGSGSEERGEGMRMGV